MEEEFGVLTVLLVNCKNNEIIMAVMETITKLLQTN